ncbi:hypothetical protein [Croceibacterium mercuriale]|uniref:hypothetical protein n=1 Tax=Croceibacterium mercuriale TaxID=1572751 RepID=UPI00068A1243|nr:hypothetical protein [Croceibacterium mercuriale]
MNIRTLATAAALACTTALAPAALAQATAPAATPAAPAGATGVTAGATIYGPDGQPVGTVEQVEGTNVVVNTGTQTATLPASTFSAGANGPTIGWNKADLEAAIAAEEQKAVAALDTKLVAGAQLFTVDNVAVGTITEVKTDGMVVVEHTTAGPIQLPKEQMTVQGENLTFLATAADLNAAVSSQASAAAPATDAVS